MTEATVPPKTNLIMQINVPKANLTMQINAPIESDEEGKKLYDVLKEIIFNVIGNAQISGQITRMFELNNGSPPT